MSTAAYAVRRLSDAKAIGSATLTDEQFAHYVNMSDGAEGVIRLGALPHSYYDLDTDYQDTSADTSVYLD